MQRLEMVVDGYIDDTDIEDCTAQLQQLEYEEVTLRRSGLSDPLGLTLCYGGGEDIETDIFVSQIDPDSIAATDGRVKEGDQILQINGEDVHTRDKAVSLFRQNTDSFTLLLARSSDTPNEDEPEATIDQSLSPMPEQITAGEEEADMTDTTRDSGGSAMEKDSGISRTTDSEPECLPPPIVSPMVGSVPYFPGIKPELSSTTICTPTEATYQGSTKTSDGSSAFSSPESETRMRKSCSTGSLDRDLASLHHEMEAVRIECDKLIAQHASAKHQVHKQLTAAHALIATVTNGKSSKMPSIDPPQDSRNEPLIRQVHERLRFTDSQSSPPPVPAHCRPKGTETKSSGLLTCQDLLAQQQLQKRARRKRDETSSAYNTGGESLRSTPRNAHFPCTSVIDNRGNVHHMYKNAFNESHIPIPLKSSDISIIPPGTSKNPARARMIHRCQNFGNSSKNHQKSTDFPYDIMYTSPENLQQTIMIQQRLFRQAMIQQAQELKCQYPLGKGPVSSASLYSVSPEQEFMEWKIKRRSDGSRYVTKRPARNRILEKRAQKLTSERVGLSTDDDALSELKIGRYWSKSERKTHLEKSRERKQRQEELLRRKFLALRQPSGQTIIQLSHKKMMRRKGQQLFDNFTTVQEFLTHGNRILEGNRAMGILSVTTV